MCFWICFRFSVDGADDTNKSEKNEKNDQKSGDSSQTSGEKQSDLDSTSTSHHCKCVAHAPMPDLFYAIVVWFNP